MEKKLYTSPKLTTLGDVAKVTETLVQIDPSNLQVAWRPRHEA